VTAIAERIWQHERTLLCAAGIEPNAQVLPRYRSIRLAVRSDRQTSARTMLVSGQSGALYGDPGSGLVQRLPPVRQQSLRHLLSAWLAHLMLCGEQPEDCPVTTFYLIAGDQALGQLKPVVFDRQSLRLHHELSLDTVSPLSRLVIAAQTVSQQVTPLFPRTAAAWLELAEPGEPIDAPQANTKAFEQARKVYEGADNLFTTAECLYAWPAALFRGQPPDVSLVLRHSLPLFAPIWWAVRREIKTETTAAGGPSA